MGGQARIAIVGGGPAGATCARELARRGAEVTLFEARPGADKPCGGGIPARALREFPALADPSLPRRVVPRVVLVSPAGRRAVLDLSEGIHVFKRALLDARLRDLAVRSGAALVRSRVRSVRRAAGGWEIDAEDGPFGPFDHLVGADGVRGVVRRAVAGPHEEDDLTLALYAYVHGVAEEEMILKFFGGFSGYLWVFPRTDHISVGICASFRRVEAARLEGLLHEFVERCYPKGRLAPGSLKGYFIPASRRPAAAAGERWALIGDAGGFVDPLTREGIAHAMRSAVAAAREVSGRAGLRTPDLPASLSKAHSYNERFFQAPFLERMIRLASAAPSIGRVLGDLLEGEQSYPTLKPRLLLNALPCGVEIGAARLARLWRERPSAPA